MEIFGKVKLLPVHLLLLITWALPGLGKLLGPGVPQGFADTFGATFLGTFPGITVSFYSIALLETFAAALALISLFRREFLPGRGLTWLKASLVTSLFIFVQLGFGKRLIQEHGDAATLFLYFCGTVVILFYVESQEKKGA
jgi:hypothetical protein